MRQNSKKKINLVKLRQEVQFVSYWPNSSKPQKYDPLLDKHNLYFFQLPTIQKHLRKLKKKAKKDKTSIQNEEFIQSLNRNRIIFGSEKKVRSQSKLRKRSEESCLLNTEKRNNLRSQNTSTKKLDMIAEQLPRLSIDRKLPSIISRKASPQRIKTQRQVPMQRYNAMEFIIKKRLGTMFE